MKFMPVFFMFSVIVLYSFCIVSVIVLRGKHREIARFEEG